MDDKGIGKSYADDFIKFICENEKEIAAADFDIFGGAYQDKTKMQTIRNTQHRETPKNRFQILNIRPDMEFEFYKDRLRDFVNLLHESFKRLLCQWIYLCIY